MVFWERTRAGVSGSAREPRRRGAEAAPEQIEFYAPGVLSAGEIAELQTAFAASLGRAFVPRRQGPLLWWWIGGVVATVLLALGATAAGLGYAWIALAAALTALPFGVSQADGRLSRRDTLRARPLARRLDTVQVVPGGDARQQERITAIWRAGRRGGAPGKQLAELEVHCREQAWPAAAAFYAEQRRKLEAPLSGGQGATRRWPLGRRRGRERSVPAHAMVEMRSW